jgi:hypothetical protein
MKIELNFKVTFNMNEELYPKRTTAAEALEIELRNAKIHPAGMVVPMEEYGETLEITGRLVP